MQAVDELKVQVRRARRRLAWQRFVELLGWCWFATLLAAFALVVLDKYHPLGVDLWYWLVGALGSGLVVAAVWTLATRKSVLAAAIEIDRRHGLKERISSAVAMPQDERETQAGRALLSDATHRVARLEIADRFAVRPPRQILLPLLPGVLAGLVAWLVPPAATNPAAAKADTAAVQKQVQRSSEALRRNLAERREQAEKLGLKDAEQLLKKLEAGSNTLFINPPQRKQALIELSDLSRQLQERRQALQGAEKLKQQLEQLKNLERGPADKFAQALSKGDFKRASEELRKIKDQLANSNLDQRQKSDLAKQLKQMQEKLNKLADAHQAAREDLQKRIDQLKQAGQTVEADKLQEQLEKLQSQVPQMERLQQLAQQLGQCSKCLRDGQLPDAEKQLDQLQTELGDLQKQLDEMEMLDLTMDELGEARNRMNCPHCGGLGCEWCQDGEPGFGLGRGRGLGERPEAKTDTSTYDSQVKQKIGPGAATVAGTANGPNVKGNVQEEIQQQFDSARQGATDPLSGRRIPRQHRQHAQEYFDRFREGK